MTTSVYSVFDAESEKMNEVEDVAYFEKDVFFEKKDTLRVFRIFRLEGSIC